MHAIITVVPFDYERHREQVIDLWTTVFGYETAHNDPSLVIDKKVAVSDELFFVAMEGGVVGTVMCGYDGHRGWIYSLAVRPDRQRSGIGRALMSHAEHALDAQGCTKVNLQILEGNQEAVGFYERLGFTCEPRISMGKLLAEGIDANRPNKSRQ